jgi:transcription-repair coupling factor (superfamily II helicase)
MQVCFFTDHQIFDRFHKYSLRSDTARAGKMALTMKELQEMEPGDYIVHVDYGIGKFGGLVRVPTGNSYQEMIRIIYQNNDKVDVSIHSLYKISKYRRGDTGEAPRLSTLGTGAWDRLKERTKSRIKDIARDLIRLYAKRRHEKGICLQCRFFHAA